ncbi:MAG: O-methyltransferase [Bacteroidota bacterium]
MSTTVFGQVDNYLSKLYSLEDEILLQTEASIRENGMPEHSVSAVQGQFLSLLVQMCQAKRIIEVGTLGGYSTIWLGRALREKGKLTSIEVAASYAAVARRNIELAGLQDTVEIICGDALEVLHQMDLKGEVVDLFFMDADKPNYVAYFEWALAHSRPGSLILADNVIRDGQVLDADSPDEKVKGVRAYLDMLAREERATHSVLQQVGIKAYDGLAISMVK